MEKKIFREKFKQIRIERKLNQSDFAHRLKVSPSFISEIEAGKKLPGAEILVSLKRHFNISLDWLFGEEEGGESPKRKEPNEQPKEPAVEETRVLQVFGVRDNRKKEEQLEKRIQELEEEKKILTVRLDQAERMFAQALTIIKPEEVHT